MVDEEYIWNLLKTVLDPDVNVNIVDLGLIYSINISDSNIMVQMTLTSPTCPMGDVIFESIKNTIQSACPEMEVQVKLVWDPPWNSDMISEIGKMELGLL